ncbi:anti-sigma factor [Sphaerisporangium sp. TRM90804]|uniref:anti-sigma factor family protein n=1 Tax=Sphaerisporangium sp. TRM90804 TaxID=3031113 RepID=UPI002449E041|nr:anti-sigma factor [Sphaerisporangium sp. TRM90804]MDH2429861.1 anti-sigma factor [Sphaerisporangium sp. TRM90804]
MSHLAERASALIDGELGHAERERALAHLTFCADCRAELESIRALKSRLRSLDAPAVPADLTMSLLRMSEPGGPLPPRMRPFPNSYSLNGAPADTRPRRGGGFAGPGRSGPGRRAGYVAVGVASAAVALGTLFMVGGAENRPSAPPVEMFANQPRSTTPGGQVVRHPVRTPSQVP